MSTMCLDTQTMICDAIDASVNETFSMMIGKPISHEHTERLVSVLPTGYEESSADRQLTVVMGLSGGLQGSVSVCIDEVAAFDIARRLIDHETAVIDQTVVDAVGELGNMIVGGAKCRLKEFQLTLGLPCVLLTGKSRLAFPTNCQPIEMQYETEGQKLFVFVTLVKSASIA